MRSHGSTNGPNACLRIPLDRRLLTCRRSHHANRSSRFSAKRRAELDREWVAARVDVRKEPLERLGSWARPRNHDEMSRGVDRGDTEAACRAIREGSRLTATAEACRHENKLERVARDRRPFRFGFSRVAATRMRLVRRVHRRSLRLHDLVPRRVMPVLGLRRCGPFRGVHMSRHLRVSGGRSVPFAMRKRCSGRIVRQSHNLAPRGNDVRPLTLDAGRRDIGDHADEGEERVRDGG